MYKGLHIAILGANDIGKALLRTLIERHFQIEEIYTLLHLKNTKKYKYFQRNSIVIQDITTFDWTKIQLAFFAIGKEETATYIEIAVKSGCLVIDLSGLFSLEPDIPLIVPEINPSMLNNYCNRNIIAVPNSLTSQLLVAIKPLIDIGGIFSVNVTSLLSISERGKEATDALIKQSIKLLNGIPIDEDDYLGQQLAFNMLPILPDNKGSVLKERYIIEEIRKILQNKELKISIHCVYSPVFYGHAQIVSFEAVRPITLKEARIAFLHGEDIKLTEENSFPTQASNAVIGTSKVCIGCVHNDYGIPEKINFWSVADNIQFGGALIAVKIAEKLIQKYSFNI